MEEIFDIYSRKGQYLGSATKTECHSSKATFYHKPVWLWIINSKNEILIQKHAKNKKAFPNLWDMSCAGHVRANETSIDGAIREVFEELGIKTNINDYEFITEYIYDKGMEIAQVYLLKLDVNKENFILNSDEVETVKWVSYDDFIKIFYSDLFIPHDKEYKDLMAVALKKII